MAHQYNSPRIGGNGEVDKDFLMFLNTTFSNHNSPMNVFNQNLFPLTDKNEKIPTGEQAGLDTSNTLGGINLENGIPNLESFNLFKTPNFSDSKHFFGASGFSLPANINPLNSMTNSMSNFNNPINNPLSIETLTANKDYNNLFSTPNANSNFNYPNNCDKFDRYELTTPINNKDKGDKENTQPTPSSTSQARKLPKLDIDMINYSDPSKVMTDRVLNDLFNQSINPENLKNMDTEEKNNLWNMINTNLKLRMELNKDDKNYNIKMDDVKSEECNEEFKEENKENNEGSQEFKVLKPMTMQQSSTGVTTSPPKKENPINTKDTYTTTTDLSSSNTATNHILSLNISPKASLFVSVYYIL